MEQEAPAKHFFVSYNRADKTWAEWIAWQLEGAGYSVVIQAWDFRPGHNFVLEMDRAAQTAERTLLVLSPSFLASSFTQPEWAAAFKRDPTGEKRLVVPVRVAECDPPGLLGQINYIDLVGRPETEAIAELLNGVKLGRARPEAPPGFPGAAEVASEARTVQRPARFPGALPPIWNVPHLRNPHFTGRDELLEELDRTLTAGPAALTALSGLGGIGKTQTAVEYAYRHHTEFDLVWWLPAEEPATLLGDYATLAEPLKLPQAGEKELAAVAQAVRRTLEQRERWLLVFDNARGERELRDLLPRGGGGRVLVTSRNPNWDRATPLEVPLLARASSVAFLLNRTGQADDTAAGALAAELGDLPLALEQAAAFVVRRNMTLADYLVAFREQRDELWRRETPPLGYPDTVRTTWVLAVDRLKEEQPAAVALLNLGAFLAPEAIPSQLFTAHHEALPPPLNEAAADPWAWGDLVEALRSYSLAAVADGGLSFHRLVQAATRERLPMDERQRWAGAAVALMNAGFPYDRDDPETWGGSRELLAHALAAAGHAEPMAEGIEGTARLFDLTGSYLETVAEFDRARACHERALRIAEAALGPDHADVAIYVNNLGFVLWRQGDLAGARAAFERARRIWEAALGGEHPQVATATNNLGAVLRAQGDLAGARAAYERARRILERALGGEHPQVATATNNLGLVLHGQGDLAGARAAFERALRIDEAAYGPDHPDVAIRLANLGGLLVQMGDRATGIGHLTRALSTFEKFFAADHPYVVETRRRLRAVGVAGFGESEGPG